MKNLFVLISTLCTLGWSQFLGPPSAYTDSTMTDSSLIIWQRSPYSPIKVYNSTGLQLKSFIASGGGSSALISDSLRSHGSGSDSSWFFKNVRVHKSTSNGYTYTDSLGVGQGTGSGARIGNNGAGFVAQNELHWDVNGNLVSNSSMTAPVGNFANLNGGFFAPKKWVTDTLFPSDTTQCQNCTNANQIAGLRNGNPPQYHFYQTSGDGDSVVMARGATPEFHTVKMDSALVSGDRLGMGVRETWMYDDFDAPKNTPISGRVAPTGQAWLTEGDGYGSLFKIVNGAVQIPQGDSNSYMWLPYGKRLTQFGGSFSFTSGGPGSSAGTSLTLIADSGALGTGLGTMYHLIFGPTGWDLTKRIHGGSFIDLGDGGWDLRTDSTIYHIGMRLDTVASTVTVEGADGINYVIHDTDVVRIKATYAGYQIKGSSSLSYRPYWNATWSGKTISPSQVASGRGAPMSEVTGLKYQRQTISGALTGGAGWYRIATGGLFGTSAIIGNVEINTNITGGFHASWQVATGITPGTGSITLGQQFFKKYVVNPITKIALSSNDIASSALDVFVPGSDTVFYTIVFNGTFTPVPVPVVGAVPYTSSSDTLTAVDGLPFVYYGSSDTIVQTDGARALVANNVGPIIHDSLTAATGSWSAHDITLGGDLTSTGTVTGDRVSSNRQTTFGSHNSGNDTIDGNLVIHGTCSGCATFVGPIIHDSLTASTGSWTAHDLTLGGDLTATGAVTGDKVVSNRQTTFGSHNHGNDTVDGILNVPGHIKSSGNDTANSVTAGSFAISGVGTVIDNSGFATFSNLSTPGFGTIVNDGGSGTFNNLQYTGTLTTPITGTFDGIVGHTSGGDLEAYSTVGLGDGHPALTTDATSFDGDGTVPDDDWVTAEINSVLNASPNINNANLTGTTTVNDLLIPSTGGTSVLGTDVGTHVIPLQSVGTGDVALSKSDTFTCTLTGVTATITGTCKYTVIGKQVTLSIPTLIGTTNANTMTVTGLPGIITPASQVWTNRTIVLNNASYASQAYATIETSGTVTFYLATATTPGYASNTFASSITDKGYPVPLPLIYVLP